MLHPIKSNILFSHLSPLQLSPFHGLEVWLFLMSVKNLPVRSTKGTLLQLDTCHDIHCFQDYHCPLFPVPPVTNMKTEFHCPFCSWEQLKEQHSLSKCNLFNLTSMKCRYDKYFLPHLRELKFLNLCSVKTTKSVSMNICQKAFGNYSPHSPFNFVLGAFSATQIFQ